MDGVDWRQCPLYDRCKENIILFHERIDELQDRSKDSESDSKVLNERLINVVYTIERLSSKLEKHMDSEEVSYNKISNSIAKMQEIFAKSELSRAKTETALSVKQKIIWGLVTTIASSALGLIVYYIKTGV